MAFGTGFWNNYPGTDLHEIDLHYVLMQLLQLRKDMQQVVDSQAITFADPINWNITSQYPANQVVLDSNGDGYISRQPVPAGIPLSNSNYWTQIFSFNDIADRIRASIAVNAGTSATTPQALAINDLVWWQGDIYRALAAMPAGTAFIEGTNVERYTVDDKIDLIAATINQFVTDLQNLIDTVDGLDNALQGEIQDRGDADTALQTAIDDEIRDRIAADDELDEKIDYVNSRIQQYFGHRGNWFYVDGTGGDDDNDGSMDHPFKTIEKALLKANDGYANLSIGMLTSGTYTVDDYNNLTYLSLHIYSYAPDVIIDFARTDFTTYGLHLNLRGENGKLIIRSGGENGFHFESGQLYAENVYFNFPCRIIGTNCHFRECEFDSIHASESNIVFNGALAFHNESRVAVVVRLQGGVCSFYQSSITLDDAPPEGTTFILVQAGVVAGFQNSAASFNTDLNSKYQYGLRSYNSIICIYTVRMRQFTHIADTPFTKTAGSITSPGAYFQTAEDISGATSGSPYGITTQGYVSIHNTSAQTAVLTIKGNIGGAVQIGGAAGYYAAQVTEGMKVFVSGTCDFARFTRVDPA